MKRTISILLMILMILSLPAQCLAAAGDVLATIPEVEEEGLTDSITSLCAYDGAFYMVGSTTERIFVHRPGEAEAEVYPLVTAAAEDGTEEGTDVQTVWMLVPDGETLKALAVRSEYGIIHSTVTVKLYTLNFTGETFEAVPLCDVDLRKLQLPEDPYFNIDNLVATGTGYAVFSFYADDGGGSSAWILNCADGSLTRCADHVVGLTAWSQGRVLIEQYDDREPETVRFLSCDPADAQPETQSTLTIEPYATWRGLTADPDSGEVYVVNGGEICALDIMTGEITRRITDLPIEAYEAGGAVLDGAWFAMSDYAHYAIRSLNEEETSSTTRLRVCDMSWSQGVTDAYMSFTGSHEGTSVVLSHDNSGMSLIDAMMNHDSSVDIYIMHSTESDFEAVRSRGFIADLSGNDRLQALYAAMPPQMQEMLSVDGNFAILPVEYYIELPAVNEKVLAKLGLSYEDLPTNWSDMLDFIAGLQLPEDGSVRLVNAWNSQENCRENLMEKIFIAYQLELSVDPYGVPDGIMTDMLTRLQAIDFGAFGIPKDSEMYSEDGGGIDYDGSDGDNVLFDFSLYSTLSDLTDYGTPMLLSLTADSTAWLPMDMTVAFINPYSANRDLAVEFMAEIAEHSTDEVRYLLDETLVDPVENPFYESTITELENYLETQRAQLEEASPADRQMIEEGIAGIESYLEEARGQRWSISEEDIAWLRAHNDHPVMMGGNWLYSGGSGDDDAGSGEVYDLVQQYVNGQVDARTLMGEVDRRIRMMILEGY